MRVGILVRLLDALVRPVARAERADLPFGVHLVERLDHFGDGAAFVVAVQKIDVDLIHPEKRKRHGKILAHAFGVHALFHRFGVVMAAFGQKDDVVPPAAMLEPHAEAFFRKPVVSRAVERVDAERKHRVQKFVCIFAADHFGPRRAEEKARDGPVHGRNGAVFHTCPPKTKSVALIITHKTRFEEEQMRRFTVF